MTPARQRLLIHDARLFTPHQPGRTGWLLVEGSQIRTIGFADASRIPAACRRHPVRALSVAELTLQTGVGGRAYEHARS